MPSARDLRGARASAAVLLALAFGISAPALASRVELGAVLEGEWRTRSAATSCAMSRRVSGVGEARFERMAGAAERFVLVLDARLPARADAGVHAALAVPPWHPSYPRDEHLAALPAPADGRTLQLPTDATVRLRAALAEGWLGIFSSDAQPADGFPVPGTTFRAAEQSYLRCVAALPAARSRSTTAGRSRSVGPAAPIRTRVPFSEQEIALDARGRRALEQWLAKADLRSGKRIAIAGFADDAGGFAHNVALSRRRAEAVAAFLRGQGVAAARIDLRYFGDQYPVGDSLDSHGRAANRRVTVRLR